MSEVFNLSYGVLSCTEATTLEDFESAVVAEDPGEEVSAHGNSDTVRRALESLHLIYDQYERPPVQH